MHASVGHAAAKGLRTPHVLQIAQDGRVRAPQSRFQQGWVPAVRLLGGWEQTGAGAAAGPGAWFWEGAEDCPVFGTTAFNHASLFARCCTRDMYSATYFWSRGHVRSTSGRRRKFSKS